MLKFKLLEQQTTSVEKLTDWALATPYLAQMARAFKDETPLTALVEDWIAQLVRAGAAEMDGAVLRNRD